MTGAQRDETQESRILKLLQARAPAWVSALELSHISLQYNARVLELRRQGHIVLNRVEVRDGVRHGYFKLIDPRGGLPSATAETEQSRLFSREEMAAGADPEYPE